MKVTKKHISIFAIIAATGLILPIKVDYKIYSTGKIFSGKEWILERNSEGHITSTIKDNLQGVISFYGNKEVQRGDVYDFQMEPEILTKKFIAQGEKIGSLQSNNLERLIVELEGQLQVEKALLGVYSTGEKTEMVAEAQTNLNLAKEKFEIQKKLIERKKKLFSDSLIAPQEYDLAMNEYEVSKINYELAQARVQTISTGEKPQQLKYSMEKIASLENQIKTLRAKVNALAISSPFSGLMVRKKTNSNMLEILANVVDTSTYIVIAPVQLKELKYMNIGGKCFLRPLSSDCIMEATITHIDNGIQVVNGKQAVYVTAMIEKRCPEILPGIIAQISFSCGKLTILEYIERFFKGLFYR